MSKINEGEIRAALEKVNDPDIGKSLKELDAIANIEIKENLIDIKLRLVQPIHRVAEKINAECVRALKSVAPDYECDIELLEAPFDLGERNFLKNVKNIVCVASGKGGVGKSTVSANIAAALAKTGARVGLLDGDVYGPSQPTMFGLVEGKLEAVVDDQGATIAYPLEKYDVKVASMGFVMNRDEAAIVRGPMLAGYFSMLFEQVDWGALDYLVFDLPPGTGDVQLTMTQKIPLTGAVVVTTPQEISLADARRSVAMFRRVEVDILGVIENMSYFAPPDMPDKKYHIFGEGGGKRIAEETRTELLGRVPLNIAMREDGDSGKPIVLTDGDNHAKAEIFALTDKLVSQLRRRNFEKGAAPKLEISV